MSRRNQVSLATRPIGTDPMGPRPATTKKRRRFGGASFLGFPTWAFVAFFFVVPLALILWYSFGYKPDLFTAHSNDVLSFDRYAEALDATFFGTFWNTLQIGLVGTALCLLISIPFAYWMAIRLNPKWRPLALALVLVPFWTNFLVRTLGWQIVLSPRGFLSDTLQNLGLIDGRLDVLYTQGAVQLGVVYNYLPLMILPLFVAINASGPALREASKDLGANRWRTLMQITLPLAMPGIISGSLLVFIPLMGDYITASVLGGAQGNMIGQLVAGQFNTAQNWALGSAMAVLLMLFIAAAVAVVAVIGLIVRGAIRANRKVDLSGGAA
ncbi:ABC transporter permease [Glaciibacter psychrotolerans]|uniref:Spermidine/putrescine transport system permease protein n=1 Tax=Glaciibacter psychrotolerans TaxID=670054 RepID=A0A7Z0J6X6_9MICO|nr:spermidine/putrescine transport system permease protein [Leifsonia psychrotolerans]